MNIHKNITDRLFNIKNTKDFNGLAIEIFHLQYKHNSLYHDFVDNLNISVDKISHYQSIPFLPVEFFKTRQVLACSQTPETIFYSSGTGGENRSKHYICKTSLYRKSFVTSFEMHYGKPSEYTILALLPSYLERSGSSLVYMIDHLIRLSENPLSGFFLNEFTKLSDIIDFALHQNKKVLLFGVTFALINFSQKFNKEIGEQGIVMETGGMKGRGREMIREEVHAILKKRFNVAEIHSEYGMTELLSQAYSHGNGIFSTPPWMKVLIRDINDPLSLLP